MKDQVYRHEENSLKILRQRLDEMQKLNEANIVKLRRVRRLLEPLARPKFAFEFFPPLVVSSLNYEGFDSLRTHIVGVATGRIPDEAGVPYFRGHVGALLPPLRMQIQQFIEDILIFEYNFSLLFLNFYDIICMIFVVLFNQVFY